MKLFSLSIIVFFSVVGSMQAQQKSTISSGVERKLGKADKKIAKGDAIVAKKEKYTRQIEAIDAQGKSRKGKVRRLETKCNKIIVSSASFYKEGYGKKYSIYKKVVNNGVEEGILQQGAMSLINKAKSDYRSGRKLRRKSGNLSDVNRAADMLLDANEAEADAIQNLIKAAGKYRQIEIETEPTAELVHETPMDSTEAVVVAPVAALVNVVALVPDSAYALQIDSVPESGALLDAALLMPSMNLDSLILSADSIMPHNVAEPLLLDAVELEAEAKEVSQVYFAVQFMANRKAVSKERLRQVYDGPFERFEHVADGWYRYSFGKFSTVNEANEMKTRSGVQGYVVAYLNEERISIKEASALLDQ